MAQPFSAQDFRAAASEFATGVTIVTTLADNKPVGMTVNSFASVSLDPPLVVWNVGQESDSYQTFLDADVFAVNVLSAEQMPLARRFATRGADKFADAAWEPGYAGLPVLSGSLTCFECRTVHRYPGGDHMILVGNVIHLHPRRLGQPLLFHRGKLRVSDSRSPELETAGP